MKKIIGLIFLTTTVLSAIAQTNNLKQKADSLKNAEEYELAIKLYSNASLKEPTNTKLLHDIAFCYYNIDMIEPAIDTLNKAIKINKNDPENYVLLSEIYSYTGDYEAASININKAIQLKPDTAIYYIKQGSIFLLSEELENALNSFQTSLKYDKYSSSAYYLISYVYSVVNYADSALKYINLALNFEEKGDFHKLKAEIFYAQSRFTDAIFEINKAIAIEGNIPEYVLSKAEIYSQLDQHRDVIKLISPYLNTYSQEFYHYAIVSYFNLGMNDSAYYYLNYALQNDPQNDIFYYLQGYISYVNKDYNNSYINFLAAIELNPSNVDYFYMACNSKILLNTDSTTLDFNNRFYEFNLDNIKQMKKLYKSKNSKYYYPKLLSKFNIDPTSLSLDEYFMFYFGHSFQKSFSGYANSNPQVSNAFNNQNYEECITLAQDFLLEHPCSTITYFYLANSYYMLGDYNKTIIYLTVYYGFINSIMATGEGTSKENAMIVISPSDEYAVFQFNNLQFAGQELISNKKNYYDIFYYYSNNIKQKMYFNIDLYFGKN
ncbi:MAG: DUF4919 domain-containing protein [Bacteroidales bacterium]|nr:DUF4919 domain-containing protein [Bacteroidales bacterium]